MKSLLDICNLVILINIILTIDQLNGELIIHNVAHKKIYCRAVSSLVQFLFRLGRIEFFANVEF